MEREDSLALHLAVAEAIIARNTIRAPSAMERHIENSIGDLLKAA